MTGRPKPCADHLGIEYPSAVARARAYGLSRQLVGQRLAAGRTLAEALTTPPTTGAVATVVNGVSYPSRNAASRALGITARAVRHRATSPETRRSVVRWLHIEIVLDTWRAVTGRARRAREVAA